MRHQNDQKIGKFRQWRQIQTTNLSTV